MPAWMQTYSGIEFNITSPEPDKINILDIAHALSMQGRYGGHTTNFYSVAQHSWLMSHKVPKGFELDALLHDASEAYLVDIPRPVKQHLPEYYKIEAVIQEAIAHKFGCKWPIPEEIHTIDNKILVDERRCLMVPTHHTNKEWCGVDEGLGLMIHPMQAGECRVHFLDRFSELMHTRREPGDEVAEIEASLGFHHAGLSLEAEV